MGVEPWSRGPALRQALQGSTLLTLLLLLIFVVEQTNSHAYPEWNYGRNKLVKEIKESMNEINDRQDSIENSLIGMQKEIQLIGKHSNLQRTEREHFENINCPDHFVTINTTGECILIAKTYSTYTEASDNCASIGAHLVVPRDVMSLEAFLLDRASSLSHDTFWLGADDHLPSHIWRWVDGRPVDALTLLYNSKFGLMNNLYQPGGYCGVLRLGKPENNRLSAEQCNSEVQKKLPYLCEIEPESEATQIKFPFEEICPKEYSQLSTGECIYISSVEDPLDFDGAVNFCKAQGSTLMFPNNLTILEAFLVEQTLDEVYSIWMDKAVRHLDQEWDDLMRQSRRESDTTMCTMFMTRPLSIAESITKEIKKGIASCSLRQRFICRLKMNPKLYNARPGIYSF